MYLVKKIFKAIDNELKQPIGIKLSDRDTGYEIHKWEITGWQFLKWVACPCIIIAFVIRILINH